MKQFQGKGDSDTYTHTHLTNQIDFGGHFAGQFLLIRASLEFLEVVVETDLLSVFRRNCNAKGGNDSCLTYQIDVDADSDDSIEGVFILQQRYTEQILIFQLGLNQLLHGVHQFVGCFLIIVVFGCRTIGVNDLLQRGLRLVEDVVHAVSGGCLDLQAHGSLSLEENGHIHPQESTVHVNIHCQLLLKEQIG